MFYLAWRNLAQNRTQFLLGVGGVALALILMLALDGLLAGSEADLVAYIERSGADVFVAQEGVRNMHMAASSIDYRDLVLASHAEGVASASPILYTTSVVETAGADVLSYIIGFDPDEPLGGPQQVVAGRRDLRSEEVIIDLAVARSQGLDLGDQVDILGETFTIAGITQGLTNIVNSVSFITLQDFQRLRSNNVVSYALLKLWPEADPNQVAETIMARNEDVTALPQARFAAEERQIIKDMAVELLNLMNLSGLLIGLAVTALTLYTSILHKRREYGILKALGAKNRHLYAVVVAQAVLSLGIGFGLAVGVMWFLGAAVPLVAPTLHITLTGTAAIRALLSALVIGALAALAPAWQIARLDPADVFRG